jgi:hypothetical protein
MRLERFVRTKWVSSRAWAVTLAAAALSAGTAIPADAAATPGWRITQTYAADSVLYGAVATGASDAWAVGASLPVTSSAAATWQAGNLRQAGRLRQTGREGGARALAEAATTAAEGPRTILRHYNGHAWQAVSVPAGLQTGAPGAQAIAATSGSDAWLAGSEVTGNTEAAKLEHWNGTKWNAAATLENSYPSAIVAVNAKDYWAFGSENYAGINVAWHYTGKTWVTTPIQEYVQDAAVLNGTVWAIGQSETTGDLQAQYLSGAKWATAKLPAIALTADESLGLDAVTSGGSGTLTLAVEVDNDSTGNIVKSLLLERTGSKWSTVTIPASVLGGDTIYSVAPDGEGGLWLEASANNEILIHDTKAGQWTKQAVPSAKGDQTYIGSLTWIPGSTSLWGVGWQNPASGDTAQAVILKYGN